MEDLFRQYVESFVEKNIIEFQTDKSGGGLIWEVCGYEYEHDKGIWNLMLSADDPDDEDGDPFEEILPVQHCLLFTPDSIIEQANKVDAKRLQAGSRVFVKSSEEKGHRRGTIMRKSRNKVKILYDKCELLGGKTKEIEIGDILFDISAAIQDSGYTSYGPLFQVGERIVTDQEYEGTDCKGTYRHTVQILEIKNDSKELFDLPDTLHEQMVNGQAQVDSTLKPHQFCRRHITCRPTLSDDVTDDRDVEELLLQNSKIPAIHELDPDNVMQSMMFAFSIVYYACKHEDGSTKYPTTVPNLVILRTLRAYGLIESFRENGEHIEVRIASRFYEDYDNVKKWTEDDLRYDIDQNAFKEAISSVIDATDNLNERLKQLFSCVEDLTAKERERLVREQNETTTLMFEKVASSQRADQLLGLQLKRICDQINLHQNTALDKSVNNFLCRASMCLRQDNSDDAEYRDKYLKERGNGHRRSFEVARNEIKEFDTNPAKRQKVASVESALFNSDVVAFHLATFLDAKGLCRFSLTCKTLGGKQAAYSGLSLVEEAARRLFECALDWERSCLPKYDKENSIERYHHLLMLRTKLTFDQLVGKGIQYGADDQTIVQTIHGHRSWSSALCSNHVMRSGRHIAVFTILARRGSMAGIGVVRPVKIDKSDFVGDDLTFDPERMPKFLEYLRGKKTDKWGDSNVHCCTVNNYGSFCWHDLTGGDHHSGKSQIGLLLDLNEGTLSIHKDGRRIALKDNLTGEYCWYATVNHRASVSIQRG
mmetsp:Transcript_13688/g.32260  ORF Transcript_13688/g.32260 Transcript_13688/m.32260 type:complete len:765 (+) Transcript_13688:163-2457(+)